MADWSQFRPRELLGALVAHGVDFVVVGGIAVVFHGSARVTQDLDICYSAEPANLEALGAALTELGAVLYGVGEKVPFIPDARALGRTEILTLDTKLGKLDLLRSPQGAPPYPQLRDRAELVTAGAFAVRVARPIDLIAMKREAGRAKDLADVEELEAIEDLRRKLP